MGRLIDADALIRFFEKYLDPTETAWNRVVRKITRIIDLFPTADAPTTMTGVIDAIREAEYRGYMKAVEDRPKGEWIVNMPNYESICSVCGANESDFIYGTEMWYGLGESKFCPNCGSDNRERNDKDGTGDRP